MLKTTHQAQESCRQSNAQGSCRLAKAIPKEALSFPDRLTCRRVLLVLFHSCVQAAAAARVARGPDILDSAQSGDGVSVLCHVIADADGVNKRGGK